MSVAYLWLKSPRKITNYLPFPPQKIHNIFTFILRSVPVFTPVSGIGVLPAEKVLPAKNKLRGVTPAQPVMDF